MLMTIHEVASIVADSEERIQEFIRDERIPYIVTDDGISILFNGFQECMPDLYNFNEILEALDGR